MNADDFCSEEDETSSEELNAIEQDNLEMAAVLKAMGKEIMVDLENLKEESGDDDYYDNDQDGEDEEERL